jgi:glutamate synthase (NADPH/NADH) large chain
MATSGEEAIGSMGNDASLAVMSNKLKPLYNYFKQLFAQVTNPPIDPIREAMVMSLVSFIGPKPNLLDTNNINPPMRLEVSQPVLDFADIAKLRNISANTGGKFKSYELDICYPIAWGKDGIEARLASICAEVVDAVKSGHNIMIITDRKPMKIMSRFQHCWQLLPFISTGQQGLRTTTGLVVETGSARNTPLCAACRIWRRSGTSVSGDADAGDMAKDCPAICRQKKPFTTTPKRLVRA